MESKKIILTAVIEIEILNKENFNDFAEIEQRNFLFQEMLDQSVWPEAGIGCKVIGVDLKEI